MKKAGTIIGVLIFLLALGVYWITQHISNSGVVGVIASPTPVVASSQPSNSTPTTSADSSTSTSTPQPKDTVIPQQTQATSTHVFSTLSPSSLGQPYATNTEVMLVSDKTLVLLDSAYGTNQGKQLSYAVDLLYTGGTLRLFLSQSAYNALSVGDKLKVSYAVYRNSAGVQFPVIQSVSELG